MGFFYTAVYNVQYLLVFVFQRMCTVQIIIILLLMPSSHNNRFRNTACMASSVPQSVRNRQSNQINIDLFAVSVLLQPAVDQMMRLRSCDTEPRGYFPFTPSFCSTTYRLYLCTSVAL